MKARAVEKKAVVHDPVCGTRCSEEQMKIFFSGALAFKCKLLKIWWGLCRQWPEVYDYTRLGKMQIYEVLDAW